MNWNEEGAEQFKAMLRVIPVAGIGIPFATENCKFF